MVLIVEESVFIARSTLLCTAIDSLTTHFVKFVSDTM